MNQKALWIVIIILILGAGVYLYLKGNTEPLGPATDTSQVPANTYAWNIAELPESPATPGMPRSGVTLTANGKTYPAGEFDGSCFEIRGSAWELQENEITGVICWWAGGGSEVGVFQEGSATVVKVGSLDEGDAETPGFRGDFRTILSL